MGDGFCCRQKNGNVLAGKRESQSALEDKDVAMCESPYGEAIENASELLTDAMLEAGIDELIEEGRQLDQKVQDLVREVGRQTTRRLLAICSKVLEEEAKQKGMTVQRRPEVDFDIIFGPVEIPSPYLYDKESGKSSRPMKEQFGVRGGSYSDGVDRAMSEFGKETSFERAAERFEEHYGFEIGRTTVLRRTEQVGESAQQFVTSQWEEGKARYERPPAERSRRADEIVAQADGCLVRCGEVMEAKEARKRAEAPEEKARLEQKDDEEVVRLQEWKEVRTGLVRRPGEVEPTYVCGRGEWSEIIGRLFGAACRHGLDFETKVVAVADGAHGLKEAFEEWFARLQFILDKPHLRSHVVETAETLEARDDALVEKASRWVDEQLERIEQGQVTEVIADLTSVARRLEPSASTDQEETGATERLDRLIKHLTRFSRCVDYDSYEANDWPVGSGEVESAHKYVPQTRLKQPGACWNEENLEPMCALRVVDANGWWSDFWEWESDRRAAA